MNCNNNNLPIQPLNRFNDYVSIGNAGRIEDVDFLMEALVTRDDLATTRLVDYALSLVDNWAGIGRVRHYLFNGVQVQRNYAALFFKRKGWTDLLDEAVAMGLIDYAQAYAK